MAVSERDQTLIDAVIKGIAPVVRGYVDNAMLAAEMKSTAELMALGEEIRKLQDRVQDLETFATTPERMS